MAKSTIIIVDDHVLFSNSLKSLIEEYEEYEVIKQLGNGMELIDFLEAGSDLPDLLLLDIRMPMMNGIETMKWIQEHHPHLKVLALSMEDEDETIITMIRYGAKGYLLKDINPAEFKHALDEVIRKGHYYSQYVTEALVKEVSEPIKAVNLHLNDREVEFVKLACTEKTYKEIAGEMYLSPKTIDGYRETLFKRFKVKNRVGLVLFALRNELVKI